MNKALQNIVNTFNATTTSEKLSELRKAIRAYAFELSDTVRNFSDVESAFGTLITWTDGKKGMRVASLKPSEPVEALLAGIGMIGAALPSSAGTYNATYTAGEYRLSLTPKPGKKGKKVADASSQAKTLHALTSALITLSATQLQQLAELKIERAGSAPIRPFANIGKLASICQKDTVGQPSPETFVTWLESVKLAYTPAT